MRVLALTRFKSLCKLAESEVDIELEREKPKELEKPVMTAEINPNNVYYIPEEGKGLYIGRINRRYSFNEALEVR